MSERDAAPPGPLPSQPTGPVDEKTTMLLHELELRRLREQCEELITGKRGKSQGIDWQELVQRSTTVLSLLAIGLYGAVRFGHQVFGNSLSVTPEEIGLTQVAAISRAAVALVALIVMIAFPWILLVIVVGPVADSMRIGPRIGFLLGFLGILLGSTPSIYVANLMGASVLLLLAITLARPATLIVLAGVIYLIFAAIRSLFRRLRRAQKQVTTTQVFVSDPIQSIREQPSTVLWSAILVTVVLAAFVLSGTAAQRAVNKVKTGSSLDIGAGLGVLGLRGDSVAICNVPSGVDLKGRQLIYLGQADKIIVLYDVSAKQPLRLPGDSVTIAHGDQDSSICVS